MILKPQNTLLITLFWSVSLFSAAANSMSLACGPELADKKQFPNANFFIETRVYRCSVVDPGTLEINVEQANGNILNLITLVGEEETNIDLSQPNSIQVSVPNLSYIKHSISHFDGYTVSIRYLPHDDPVARSHYRHWIEEPSDPTANLWYKENLLNKIIVP